MTTLAYDPAGILARLREVRSPLYVYSRVRDRAVGVAAGPPDGEAATGALPVGEPVAGAIPAGGAADGEHRLIGLLPPLYPEWLGDRGFTEAHHVRFPYVAGEMAGGIATTRMVTALAQARMLGFFGAAGLGPAQVEAAVAELDATLGQRYVWGVNLIHSPAEPALEERVAAILLGRGVRRISASAYLDLTPPLVRCAASGLRRCPDGTVERTVRIFAKVSHPAVAAKFLAPPPAPMLADLVARGQLSQAEAELAARVPVAEDVTVEADSGGHTDNRPLTVILPAVLALRDAARASHGYDRAVRVGAAGGLGDPGAVAAAFALGAGYVLTGSVNQLAVEAGISADARELLAQADLTDTAMAPAADMFELGVQVQVLRRGTLFPVRARRLYETYRAHGSIEAIPADTRAALEREVLGASLTEVWEQTRQFWAERDPAQLERAQRDPRHRMALLFRWYLGMSSRWALAGEVARRSDYQLWAGPAVGAFNRWTAGSFLARSEQRTAVQIALNLLEGAAQVTRAHQARTYGVPVPPEAFRIPPSRLG